MLTYEQILVCLNALGIAVKVVDGHLHYFSDVRGLIQMKMLGGGGAQIRLDGRHFTVSRMGEVFESRDSGLNDRIKETDLPKNVQIVVSFVIERARQVFGLELREKAPEPKKVTGPTEYKIRPLW